MNVCEICVCKYVCLGERISVCVQLPWKSVFVYGFVLLCVGVHIVGVFVYKLFSVCISISLCVSLCECICMSVVYDFVYVFLFVRVCNCANASICVVIVRAV